MYLIANGQYLTANGKIVDGSNFSSEKLTNCGFDSDWIDSNLDGLANNWSSTYSTGIFTIVTGNGFTNNAQRMEINVTGYHGLNQQSSNMFRYKHQYHLEYDARSNKTFSTYISAGQIIATHVSTNDIMQHFSEDVTCVNAGNYLMFYLGNAAVEDIGKYLEVDNVTLKEILTR